MGGVRQLFIGVGTLMIAGSGSISAQPLKFEQLNVDLQTLILTLRQAAVARDADTIYAALAWNYKIERDFGGVYLQFERPQVNFSATYQFNNNKLMPDYQDTGWKNLKLIFQITHSKQ